MGLYGKKTMQWPTLMEKLGETRFNWIQRMALLFNFLLFCSFNVKNLTRQTTAVSLMTAVGKYYSEQSLIDNKQK